MAMMCYNTKKCNGCSSYKCDPEEGHMACWALQDGKKISEIILDVWNDNRDEENLDELNIWVSFIMCYGFTKKRILEYAAIRGIKYDTRDIDPDYPEDEPGSLIITKLDIIRLQKELKGE